MSGAVAEDCLYLNVWTPARRDDERLPVLFWIYGGGFNSGSGSVPIYDGAALAGKGVIVVNLNYRVGVYGFLAHPELRAESPSHASGNYGLLDQVAALRWVKDNVSAFGGDPSRVTIAGQSAGATSVHLLISSPLTKGLFAGAIAQSGSGGGLRLQEREVAEATGRSLASAGTETLTLMQLRALTTVELDARVARMTTPGLLPDVPALRFGPSIDGLLLPDPGTARRDATDTPILTGMTANEVTGINPNYGKATVASFNHDLVATYGRLAPQLTELYPAKSDQRALAAFDAHARDRGLASMYEWARNRLQASAHPIYGYLWTHSEPGPEASRYKAFHSSEIPYVFDTLDTSQRPFTSQDRAIARQVSAYWINFVKCGDPNGPGLPKWPTFTTTDKRIMELGAHPHARPVLPAKQLAIFERFIDSGGELSLF